MIQGDICLHTFRSPDKRRPVLILTRTDAIPNLTWITVAPITSTMRDIQSHVWLDQSDGVSRNSAINLDQVQTVEKSKLGQVVAHLSSERLSEVGAAIRFAFNLAGLEEGLQG